MAANGDSPEPVDGSPSRGGSKLASDSRKSLLSTTTDNNDKDASTPGSNTSSRGRGSDRRFSSLPRTPPRTPPIPITPAAIEFEPLRTNLNRFLTPSRTFNRLREEREELSRLTPSPQSNLFRDGFSMPLIGEVKPKALVQLGKDWLRNPKSIALLIWGIAVGVSGAILFMVMVGMLDAVLPTKKERNAWFEVSNQVINALFALMVLYLHPQRCLHLHMLCRWNSSDILKMRKEYCKNGTRKPHEWGHMLVVVLLLHLNCIGQYALCGLNWGYKRADRPAIGVAICLCCSLGGAAAGGIYNIVSPLGKDFEAETDDSDLEKGSEELGRQETIFTPRTKIYRMLEKRVSFAYREEGSVVQRPEWKGGLFNVKDEPMVSILSTFCGFCVFGWNMERLGFGNRFVHIITFILICTAPFWIFDMAALNIDNRYVRYSIGGTGIVLCGFGLLYGGYWRIRIRERFKLPGNKFCCGKPAVTDCFQWLFFPLCSLCQEVRTAEYYDIKDDKFYIRNPVDLNPSHPGRASRLNLEAALSAASEQPEISLATSANESRGPRLDAAGQSHLKSEELMASDKSRESGQSRTTLSPPGPVTASRDPESACSDSVQHCSSASPTGTNPFLDSGPLPSNNPFLSAVGDGSTEGHPTTHSSPNPFLQPERSLGSNPPLSRSHPGSSGNPFDDAERPSWATKPPAGSPAYPLYPVGSPNDPFASVNSPPVAADGRLSSSSTNPFEAVQPSSPNRRSSVSNNPFLEPDDVGDARNHEIAALDIENSDASSKGVQQ